MRRMVDENGNGFGWGFIPGRKSPAVYTIKGNRIDTPIAYFTGASGLLVFDEQMQKLTGTIVVDVSIKRTDVDECPRVYEGMSFDAEKCCPEYCHTCRELYYKGVKGR